MDLVVPVWEELALPSIKDHFSRYGFCYLLKTKADTYQAIVNWLKYARKKTGKLPICIITDKDWELVNKRMAELFARKGIKHRKTAPYHPQHNAPCGRLGQTLQNMAFCLLKDSGLPFSYWWGEAFMCASHATNRVWSSATGQILSSLWHKRTPSLDYLHVFGTPAYVHIPKQQRRKGQHRKM